MDRPDRGREGSTIVEQCGKEIRLRPESGLRRGSRADACSREGSRVSRDKRAASNTGVPTFITSLCFNLSLGNDIKLLAKTGSVGLRRQPLWDHKNKEINKFM